MELSEYMSSWLGTTDGLSIDRFNDLGPASRTFNAIAKGDPVVAWSLGATSFWQAFIDSPSFENTLNRQRLSKTVVRGERFLVCHGPTDQRLDLLILDPKHDADTPVAIPAEPLVADLVQGARRFQERTGVPENYQRLLERAALESGRAQRFGILVAAAPRIMFTRSPSPAWRVDPNAVAGATAEPSTAGVVAKNNKNQIGVTAAFHALGSARSTTVAGHKGIVVSDDIVSDSCFIALQDCPIPPAPPACGLAGPLRGLTPRVLDPVHFDGIGSKGAVNTVVTSWSPDLPFVVPYSQLKVLTKPVTISGDSGAALIDRNDQVLGFAFFRTGFGEPLEFATWIWAESVFNVHGLTTP
jgi:hypothetical protein